MPRTLVAYYSWTGTTKTAAEAVAKALGADLERIEEAERRDYGLWNAVIAALGSVRKRRPAIKPPRHDPDAYDLVVLGTPVWAGDMASPMRSYLAHHDGSLRETAFFVTHAGGTPKKAFARLAIMTGLEPLAAHAFRSVDVRRGRIDEAVTEFAAAIDAALKEHAHGKTSA
jgi:flavodoxin